MNLFLLATSVTSSVNIGGTSVDLTSANSVHTLITTTMQSIHVFALTISLCIFLFAITRNYTQFGDHGGVRFVAAVLVTLVMIFAFPKICDSLQNATERYSEGTSQTIENMFCWLTEQKINAGSGSSSAETSIVKKIAHLPENIMHSIQSAMCNIFYVNGLWIGKGIRDIVYFIFKSLYNGALCLTPIFFAAILIQETRQTGVQFITSCIGMAMMPLCFLFGDLCNIWLSEHMWNMLGLGSGGTFWTLARTGQALTNPVGTMLGYIAFGIIYALIAAIVYVVLPFLYMKMFKTGSPGSPAGMIAGAVGKAVNAAIVGGAVAATGGAAAPAAAGSSAGGASAAKAASSAAGKAGETASAGTSKIGEEIDKGVEGR